MRKKILICDDDSTLLNVYQFILAKENADIITLSSSNELFSTAKQQVPALIILDIMMPDKDGIRVLQELHGDPVTASIPVIMASAVVKPEIWKQAIKFGAREFLEKPFNMTKMRETIRKYIAP